jgi:hypothetical protein
VAAVDSVAVASTADLVAVACAAGSVVAGWVAAASVAAWSPAGACSSLVDRRFFDDGRRDRFEDRVEDRFRHRRFFVNRFDNFAFFGVPFAYDYAAYGNGCWRWDGWQWINICNNYGAYNSGY